MLLSELKTGFSKTLELVGTGYRVKLDGKTLNISVGFSHPVIVNPQEGITFAVDGQNKIIVSGVDKHLVGPGSSEHPSYPSP